MFSHTHACTLDKDKILCFVYVCKAEAFNGFTACLKSTNFEQLLKKF